MAEPPWALDSGELLDRVAAAMVLAVAAQGSVGHLADVDIAVQVDPQPVRRGEAARRTGVRSAPARDDVALDVADAEPGVAVLDPGSAGQVVVAQHPGHLADIHDVVGVDVKVARSSDVGPDGDQLAGRTEDLDPVVLAVTDEHPPV